VEHFLHHAFTGIGQRGHAFLNPANKKVGTAQPPTFGPEAI